MRLTSVLRYFALYGAAVGLGATVASSCINVNYPIVAFRCNPRQQDNCPETHFCCSDDPAAENGDLPAFMGKNISGSTPYFAGMNNSLGTSGLCVNRDEIPFGSGLMEPAAANCPIPCNPTWDEGDVAAVCGGGRVCCQTVQLDAKDCVVDPMSGMYRPVTGADIGVRYENGSVVTDWSPGAHFTHQDPSGTGCIGFAGGMNTGAVFEGCVSQLTVADQRGFCMALGPGQVCPTVQPGFVDACTALNNGGAMVPPPA
jgi:hypothetical protein